MTTTHKATRGKNDRKYRKVLIARILIRDPSVPSRQVAEELNCGHRQAWLLLKEVKKESIKRMEEEIEKLRKTSVEQELGAIQKEMEEVARQLWIIISNKNVQDKDKVAALKALVTTRKDLFGLKFDAGLFIKSLGKLDINVAELVTRIKEAKDGDGGDNSESSL